MNLGEKIVKKFMASGVFIESEPDTYKIDRRLQLFYRFFGFK
jgi:hypothetical protein